MCANVLVVEVDKAAARASPPPGCASNGERAVLAHGEATGVYGTCLWRTVELELTVRNNGAGAVVVVVEDTVLECAEQVSVRSLMDC